MDRTSLSIKRLYSSQNAYGWKDVLKVEYTDPDKFASEFRGFPFTVTRSANYGSQKDQIERPKATCSFKQLYEIGPWGRFHKGLGPVLT